jgi:biopolymer transport protein ExbD
MRTVYNEGGNRSSFDSMMTPMIDVVFLLLIFFLTTSSFQKVEKQLPSASATPPEGAPLGNEQTPLPPTNLSDFNDIVIKMSVRNGVIAYRVQDQEAESFADLRSRLAAILKVKSDINIIIDPDRNVEAGEAIRVYDLIRSQGSLSVYLVAK